MAGQSRNKVEDQGNQTENDALVVAWGEEGEEQFEQHIMLTKNM